MEWPVHNSPLPDRETPIWQLYYLGACRTPSDPTLIWGTEIDMTGLEEYLQHVNHDSPVLISPSHVLLRAVALAMRLHPEFNRRVIGRRIYQYRHTNLLLSLFNTRARDVELLLFEEADRKSLVDLSRELWRCSQQAARGEPVQVTRQTWYDLLPRSVVRRLIPFHLWMFNHFNWPITQFWRREHRAAMLVNYLAFKGAAPLRMYKPSRFPNEATCSSVTLGGTEPRPMVVDGKVVVRPAASLFVRADHRLVDAHGLGLFVNSLREFLAKPAQMDRQAELLPRPIAA